MISKETLETAYDALNERIKMLGDIARLGHTKGIREAAKIDFDKTGKAWQEVEESLNDFNKLVSHSDILHNIQEQITDIRAKLMHTLDELLPDSKLTFTEEIAPYITDEEDCVRLKAKSVSKEQVTLSDDTTFDIGNIGTDDLISLIESVYSELKNKKKKNK